MLGSPLPIEALTRLEGFVETRNGGLTGWAWHPADPDRDPSILIRTIGRADIALTVREIAEDLVLARPLARPRRFDVTPQMLGHLDEAVSVMSLDGRHLLGSPADPGLERRSLTGQGVAGPVWADVCGHAPAVGAGRSPVDVVIPVYRGLAQTMACLDSVLATIPPGVRVHVVEDASPEPDLVVALLDLARRRRIRLIRMPENRGFPATANAGLSACAGRDVVLLNSDTLVPPGWLGRLRAAAYSARDIGTVTPLSNDATILSYPDADGGNAVPDLDAATAYDTLAQRANGVETVEIPTAIGFCMYVRRDCLDQVGLLREDLFAQGYGEENDFCLRARHRGWRHLAAPGVFVAHVGGQSFGSARTHLIQRNLAVLNRWHPGYDALIGAYIAADPLAPARRRMDALRWTAQRRNGSAILVTHSGGGGVDRVVAIRAAALAADGLRPVVLRPHKGGCVVQQPDGEAYPNLVFAVPDELPELARLLQADRPRHIELHHLLGHKHEILGLARLLRLPIDTYVHDYAAFCPRIALVSTHRRYCGEPDIEGCKACVADLGSLLADPVRVSALVARSTADFAASRRVVAPSKDAGGRVRRHFPMARVEVVPWEKDVLPPLAIHADPLLRRVCVVGAIGLEKGYEVLLACVRDARARRLPLEFVVVGYTQDDTRLMDAGPVFITGKYDDADAARLIREQAAHLGFIPSVFPETWCFALSRAWEAGLAVAAFDLGAQAERMRATGRGWLLPLGLQPSAVNNALLTTRLASPGPPRHSLAHQSLQP